MSSESIITNEYADFIASIKAEHCRGTGQGRSCGQSRTRFALLADRQRNSCKAKKLGWGAKVVEQISVDLRLEFPTMKGFSRTNLLYMRSFAGSYPEYEFVQQVAGQIPWFHNCVILDKPGAVIRVDEDHKAHRHRQGPERGDLARWQVRRAFKAGCRQAEPLAHSTQNWTTNLHCGDAVVDGAQVRRVRSRLGWSPAMISCLDILLRRRCFQERLYEILSNGKIRTLARASSTTIKAPRSRADALSCMTEIRVLPRLDGRISCVRTWMTLGPAA